MFNSVRFRYLGQDYLLTSRGGRHSSVSDVEARNAVERWASSGGDAMRQLRSLYAEVMGTSDLRHRNDHEILREILRELRRRHLSVVHVKGAPGAGPHVGPTPVPPPPPKPPPKEKKPFSLAAFQFVATLAPGKEADPPKLKWTVTDPDKLATSGKLEVVPTRKPADGIPIWSKGLGASDVADGSHELPWDGKIVASAEFPQGYLSCEFSPYTLRLTVEGGSPAQRREAKVEVQVVGFEIALGPKELVGAKADQDIVTKLGALPGAGKKKPVALLSNLFKTSSAEMSSTNGTSFTAYQTLWGDGCRVPIEAKVWFKDSKGQKVLAPAAWGRRKVLWDWAPVDPDLSSLHAAAKGFCEKAQDYKKAATKPPGQTCHADRGGKRSADGKPAVFSADAGAAFPYPVEAGAHRVWAGLSGPATGGPKDGMSGVVFRPGRQAGDGYKVTAYFDPVKDLDAAGEPSAAHKVEAGTFVVRREIHISKYMKKKAGLAGFAIGKVQGYYGPAFLDVVDKGGAAAAMAKAAYDAALQPAIQAQPGFVTKYAIDAAVSQYDGGDWAVTFRNFAAFRNAMIQDQAAALKAANPALTPAQAQAQATTAVDAALPGAGLGSAADYADHCNDWALDICQKGLGGFMSANDGVTILQFGEAQSNFGAANRVLNGFAPTFPTSSRSKAAFIQYATAARYASGGNSNSMEQTISHEIGHHLFLPHAPLPAANLPAGADANAHDQADLHCMMGYDFGAERKFCGLCQLRLRGWDHRKLSKNAAANKA